MPQIMMKHPGDAATPGDFVRHAIDGVQVGPPTTFEKLTVLPLRGAFPFTAPAYLTLGEALAAGVVEVTEVSKSGSVPDLKVVNRSDRPVFLLDGEELVGAKQNRVVNLSILVPEKSSLTIPVSCVEMGRWSYSSREFAASLQAMPPSGRARKTDQVMSSLSSGGGRRADQHDVWDNVEHQAKLMRVMSRTGAMSDAFTQYRKAIDGYVEAFHTSDDQLGAVFAIGRRVYGFDLFDSPATMHAYLEKLVRSYALEALAMPDVKGDPPAVEDAEHFLEATAHARVEHYPATGLGVDVRLREENVVGAALLWQEHIVHLNAFSDATAYRAPRSREDA